MANPEDPKIVKPYFPLDRDHDTNRKNTTKKDSSRYHEEDYARDTLKGGVAAKKVEQKTSVKS